MGKINGTAIIIIGTVIMLAMQISMLYGLYMGVPSRETNPYKVCNECHNYHEHIPRSK